MQDLIRLLQMLQDNGGMPQQNSPMGPFDQRTSMERNMLQGDPYADAIFQQGHGPMPDIPEPQYEQSRHPGWDSAIGAVADAAENSGFRPRNFGEAFGANFISSAARTYTDKGPGAREARNAEAKAAHKAQQKAAYDERIGAQKAYSGLAKDKRAEQARPKKMTLEEKEEQARRLAGASVEGSYNKKRELGIRVGAAPPRPKDPPKPKAFVLQTPAEKAGVAGAEKKEKSILSGLQQGAYKYKKDEAYKDTSYVKASANLMAARKRATLSALKRAKGDADALKQIEMSISPGDPLEDDPEIGAYFTGQR